MRLAHALEAIEGGPPYFSAELPRLADPELRSRVVGYLAAAPAPIPGWRTDGSFAWPESLAGDVRSRGVGPRQDFLDHIATRNALAPESVSPAALEQAARLAGGPSSYAAPPTSLSYLAGYVGRDRSAARLIRVAIAGAVALESDLGPYGWESGDFARESRPPAMRVEEISAHAAANVADQLGSAWHESLLDNARESDPTRGAPRLARVFDGRSPAGTPWFSPGRLRILERHRRERLAAYLTSGRLVVRATARMADPLSPPGDRVVPLNYRTDGTWVWQDALAYYARTRGVAPELELLCHLEETGFRAPTDVPDHVVRLAADVVRAGVRPRPQRRSPRHYHDESTGRLVRALDGDAMQAEMLTPGLRWRRCDDLWRDSRESRHAFREITDAEAVQFVDARWAMSKG